MLGWMLLVLTVCTCVDVSGDDNLWRHVLEGFWPQAVLVLSKLSQRHGEGCG